MSQHYMMPHISVESPVTHNSWEDGKYTTYDIIVNCEEDSCPLFALSRSTVSRRYREFRWLRKRLCSVSSPVVRRVPQLPTVGCPLFDDRFSPAFIENRRRGLELFLQGVCVIPTLLSEATLHLFLQTDLGIAEIDAYVERKWGRKEEVCDVVISLNRQKQTEERDEIASLASIGRWSEASILDSETDDLSEASASSAGNSRSGAAAGAAVKVIAAKKSKPKAVVSNNQVIVSDAQVISPVFGLYLPPDENDGERVDDLSAPVVVHASRQQTRVASSVPAGLDSGTFRRSASAHLQVRNGAPERRTSSSSIESYQSRPRSASRSDRTDSDGAKSPTSVDIFNRRRGKSPAIGNSPKSLPYYCSNAVWLSSAATTVEGNRRSRISSSGGAWSQATSSLSPPSSSPASSSSNGARQ